jgi:Carboxypeptidase regulatory-like domain
MTKAGRLVAATLAMLVMSATAVSARADQRRFAGRPLADALRELQADGLKIVFSSELVRPEMRVTSEPTGSPRRKLDAMLRPHGLEVRSGPGGRLLVVRARKTLPAALPRATPVPGVVAGRVIDGRTGVPLAGVRVADDGGIAATRTDESGAFVLDSLPPGHHTLLASLVGYSLGRPAVEVQSGERVELLVPLADGTGTYTEHITVMGDRFRGGASAVIPAVQTMTSAELRGLSGVLADDPLRAVQALPGVATSGDRRSEFSVRGSDFRHMGLSIDGLPTPWLLHNVRYYENNGSIALINGDLISAATLASGAQAQGHPERLGAWLDFGIREGSRDAAEGRAAVSLSSASVVGDGPIGDAHRGSWLASVRQSYLQWLIHQVGGTDYAFGFTDAQTKFVYDVTPRQQVQVGAVVGRSRLDQRQSITGPNTLGVGSTAAGVGWLGWRSTMGSALVITNRIGVVGSTFENDHSSGAVLASGSTSEISYSGGAAWTVGPALVARGGVFVDRQRASSMSTPYSNTATGSLAARRAERVDGLATTSAVDGRVTWAWSGSRGLEAGARISRWSLGGGATASPWALVALPLGRSLALRAGVSAAHQRPDFDQIVGTYGSRDARPERALSTDVGIEGRLQPELRWQATLYDRREHDVLRLEDSEARLVGNQLELPPSLVPSWRNALDGRSRGVELLIQRRAATGLSGWFSYAYGRARYNDSVRGESFWSDFDERHTINAFAEARLSPRTSVSVKLRSGSGLPIPGYFEESADGLTVGADRNTVRLPPYARLDVRGNRAFNYRRSRMTLFAEVVNVLNRTNYALDYGMVLANGRAVDFVSTQLPLLPSAGVLIEF